MDALDLIEIHQLLAEYGHAIDAKDWDRFSGLFETDAEMDYRSPRNPNIFNGVVEFVEHLKTGNHPPAHHVTNIFAFERDGAVHVHSKFLVPYSRPTHDPHRWYGGDYFDTVAKSADGRWRFSSRRCVPNWQLTNAPYDDANIDEQRRSF
jgi:3-phenylpropionate/cinnamic acid dioxygenase small subunit